MRDAKMEFAAAEAKLDKLPKWAQEHFTRLKNLLITAREERDTATAVLNGDGDWIEVVPSLRMVRLKVPGEECGLIVQVHAAKQRTDRLSNYYSIRGDVYPLVILPESSNSLTVLHRDPRKN